MVSVTAKTCTQLLWISLWIKRREVSLIPAIVTVLLNCMKFIQLGKRGDYCNDMRMLIAIVKSDVIITVSDFLATFLSCI